MADEDTTNYGLGKLLVPSDASLRLAEIESDAARLRLEAYVAGQQLLANCDREIARHEANASKARAEIELLSLLYGRE